MSASSSAGPRQVNLGIPRAQLTRSAGRIVEHLDLIAIIVLLAAAAFPATAPTVPQTLDGTGAAFWQLRIGPGNTFELALVALSLIWLVRSTLIAPGRSPFDRPLLAAALVVFALQTVTLSEHIGDASFLKFDIERLLVPIAAYLIASRCLKDRRAVVLFAWVLGTIVMVRTVQLVGMYGITGKTEFGTITGHNALLVTEDALLVIVPAALAWGALIEGRLGIWAMGATMGLLGFIFLIDFISLRRGALIMIGGALLARSLSLGAKRLAQGAGVAAVILALAVAAGPARSLVPDARYAIESTFLQSNDDSTSQRTAEFTSFGENVNGTDWITGRGLGVTWNAYASAPIDNLSFGDGESAYTRIGWHVYGLDWAYKIGFAGIVAVLLAGAAIVRIIRRSMPTDDPQLRSVMISMAVCVPPLVLLAFTNPRVALFAGMLIGVVSRCAGIAQETRRPSNFTDSGSVEASAVNSATS